MDLVALVASVTILFAVLALAFAFYSSAVEASQIRGRLEGALSGASSGVESAAVDSLRKVRRGPGIYHAIISGAWLARMEQDLRLADSRLQPVDLIAIRVALAGLGFAVPYLLLGGVLGLLLAVAAVFVGLQAPQIWLGQRKTSRSKKLEEQLPEALTFIANSLKAGFGLLQAMSMAAEQLEDPIAHELAVTIHEMNVGSTTEEAFVNLSERAGSYDMDLVVTAVLVQRSVGGNLSEILDTVAATMRERVRIRGEIKTLTAQQQLTGIVIGSLPLGVGGLFLVVSPSYITVLFTETLGQVMLAVGTLLQVTGVLIIRRILAIEV